MERDEVVPYIKVAPGDEVVEAHFRDPGALRQRVMADPGASYAAEVAVALARLEPLVAQPHEVDRVVPARDLRGTPVQMGVLGTCTNGRLEDFEQAIEVIAVQACAWTAAWVAVYFLT